MLSEAVLKELMSDKFPLVSHEDFTAGKKGTVQRGSGDSSSKAQAEGTHTGFFYIKTNRNDSE